MRIEMTQTYLDWESNLKDLVVRSRVQARIERLVMGNAGQHRMLAGGVGELKLDFGAGYRVYYVQRGKSLTILLAGGDKSTQSADIKSAITLAKNL